MIVLRPARSWLERLRGFPRLGCELAVEALPTDVEAWLREDPDAVPTREIPTMEK